MILKKLVCCNTSHDLLTLKPHEKQTELHRKRSIVLATLDYLLDNYVGIIIYDDFDPVKDYYVQQQVQAEKYFKQRKLDRLDQQLHRLTEGFKHQVNLEFPHYIRERTGYEIDIFAYERNRVAGVLAKQRIDTEEESRSVSLILKSNQLVYQDKEEILKFLLRDLSERKKEFNELSQKSKKVSSQIVETVERDGMITETIQICFGPKPVHFNQREVFSPDGKLRLTITESSDGRHPSTTITIFFEKASRPLYGTNGLYPDLNAFWKDNNTIIIETKKSYVKGFQHGKVQSFDDTVLVEYLET